MAVDVSRNARIAAYVIEKAAPRISNELKRNDAIVGIFGARGRIELQRGGDLFEITLEYAENPNFGFISKTAQVPTQQSDAWKTAKYGQAHLGGSIVLNQIEEDQVQGEFAIHRLLEGIIANAKNTVIRKVADALRAASPASTDPESIQTLIKATAFGSQTGSTGNISRSDNSTWWQNQYSNDSADLTSVAGNKTLQDFYWSKVSKGASLIDQPDFAITTPAIFASLSAANDAFRRFGSDEKIAALGFTNIKILNMTVIPDPSISSGYFYMFNTNFMKIKILRSAGMTTVGDNPETFPIVIGPLQRDIDTFNYVQLWRITFNLICGSLQRQGLMDNVS